MIHHFLLMLTISTAQPPSVQFKPFVGTAESCYEMATKLQSQYEFSSVPITVRCTADPEDPAGLDALIHQSTHGVPVAAPRMEDAPTGPDPHNAP